MRRFYKLALTSILLLAGCAGSGLFAGEPMGKQLERALEEIKKDCIARGAPPFGPGSTQYSDTSCLMFTLKPWEPGDTPESAFAHSIKLPPPHDKPKEVYKPGMSSEEYFNALCKEEAGEWVFRRVEGVRGIRQERPRFTFPRGAYGIVFYTVESGYYMDANMPGYLVGQPGGRYEFLELRTFTKYPAATQPDYVKFVRGTGRDEIVTTKSTGESNFAFAWRGIRRPNDRLHAIEGDELIIYQIEPFEVLALRRMFNFRYFDNTTSDRRTPWGKGCAYATPLPHKFIESVLTPFNQK